MLLLQIGKFNYTNFNFCSVHFEKSSPLAKVLETHGRHYNYKCNKNTTFGNFQKNLNNHEKGENTPKVNHFCSKKVMYNKYYST